VRAEISLARWFSLQTYWGSAGSCLKLSHVFFSSSGSHNWVPWDFHNLSSLKVDTAFLFILIQIDTGRAGPWIIGISSFPFSGIQTKAAKLWTHWFQPFCRRPHGETHKVLDTTFWNSSKEHNSKRSTYHQWLWWLICRSTARFKLQVQTVFTLYNLRQRHRINATSSPVTYVILMSSMFFSIVPIPTWFLSAGKNAPLFPPATGGHDVFTFLSQNNNKLYIFLHELIAFYEQTSSCTYWLKTFFGNLVSSATRLVKCDV